MSEPKRLHVPKSSFQKVASPADVGGFCLPPTGSGLPLPPGRPIAAASLTDMEKKQLEQLGIGKGEPIPGNLPEILESIRQDMENPPLPADPSLPPLKVPEAVRLDSLPPERQKQIRDAVLLAKQAAENPAPAALPEGTPESVRAAARGEVDRRIDIPLEDDVTPNRAAREAAKPEDPQEPVGSLSAEPHENHACNHCGWDDRMPDPLEVTDQDRLSFFQATLGGIPWKKTFPLFDGKMTVTVRQLTIDEIDKIYEAAQQLQRQGLLNTPEERMEQINRFRISLQLCSVLSESSTNYTFPESLKDWNAPLPQIQETVYTTVLSTESLGRILTRPIGLFNRLSVKLEAQVDMPDFWKGIGGPI